MNPLDRYRTGSLQPERMSDDGSTYQLTAESAHPVRIVGRDRKGRPVEETISPFFKTAKFVHPLSGIIVEIAMSTGSCRTDHDHNIGQRILLEKLQNAWIPIWVCPYTMMFAHLIGGPIAKPTEPGDVDCGGKPDGCEHVHRIAAELQRDARLRWEEEQREAMQMTPGQAANLMRQFAQAFDVVGEHAEREHVDERERVPRKTVPTTKRSD